MKNVLPTRKNRIFTILLLAGMFAGLASGTTACSVPAAAPELTGDGWQTASLEQVGLESGPIADAVNLIQNDTYPNVDAMLIVKDDQLVFEVYFPGFAWDFNGDQFRGESVRHDKDTLHNLASVTKSFTSTLVGIAIDRGEIRSVDETVFSFFPDYAPLSDQEKDTITLKHLLSMTSGLEWNETDIPLTSRSRQNDLLQLFVVSDPIEYILGKPLADAPGQSWYYNGGGTNILGEIIRRATGLRMDEYARQYLFDPLGITNYTWDFINPDLVHASGNLHLRPRDMAKLGYLFLKNGIWADKQIVSKNWIQEATTSYSKFSWGGGYGYQWWLINYQAGSMRVDSFNALGWGGQRITVIPDLNMVIVFTGENYTSNDLAEDIITEHILLAVRSNQE